MTRVRITEYLDIDLEDETWVCNRCGTKLTSARKNYKEGCLVAERDPTEIWNPMVEGAYTFAPDSTWSKVLEFYCPGCAVMIETEVLPPGHPITHDLELDVDSLKAKYKAREVAK